MLERRGDHMNRNYRLAKILFAAIWLTLAVIAATAQPASQAPAASQSSAAVSIPFELVTRHIMVKVRVNNSRPLSFVFDTGDKVGIVDSDVATELGLKLEGQVHVGGAGAEKLTGSMVKDATWTLDGLDAFSQPVRLALPLNRLAARFGHDFDGIIGSDFIKQFVIEVDYQQRLLKLHDKNKFVYAGSGESVPMQLNSEGHPILEGVVSPIDSEPIKGKFVLDLGSGGSLSLMTPVVSEHKLLANGLKTIRAIGVGGAGGRVTGQFGRVKSLQIGKYTIANTLVLFSEDKAGANATSSLVGNIGQLIASKFKVFLDYYHNRIIFEPTSTFAEPMDRAGTGFALTTEGKDHATVRITDVLENSPASEAGLQIDDIILSVDGTAASELRVTRMVEMFDRPNSFKLIVKRGEKTFPVTLVTRKLI
jgi:PDZ domain-containing protein/aspartyl protease